MKQRRLQLNKSSDKMPSPGDPRIRAYEAQRRIDQAAIPLIPTLGIQAAYQFAMRNTCPPFAQRQQPPSDQAQAILFAGK